ncbi:MAG TPA: SUMF1/EgtB/PvdO family nonheme iron enzyme [Polyangiaceae bacterium]|jgi:formylglycine-generating enzyme required for sulfatase activity|nr:SUMF1/EgtB/PvdO family nonheme iron enzyme [Polyangiaceae bacterium]
MLCRGALVLGACAALAGCSAMGQAPGEERTKPAQLDLAAVAPARIGPRAPQIARQACPVEMVLSGGACMDRYEAHLLVEGGDGKLSTHPAEQRPPRARVLAASRAGVKPQAYISQVEAAAACQNAGKRLCSLSEWYGACTSSGEQTYPYGASYQAGRCNVGKPHLLSLLHGANPRGWSYADFNDPALAAKPGFLALAGEYQGCVSSSGVHDLVGNLHEWVADRVDRSLPRKLPLPAVIERRIGRTTGNGIFMGGFFSTLNEHGSGCKFVTAAHEPRYHDYSTGFRCCQDAN